MNYYKVGSLDYFQGLMQTKEFIEEKKEVIISFLEKRCKIGNEVFSMLEWFIFRI